MKGITGNANDGVLSRFELKELNDRQIQCVERIKDYYSNPENGNHPAIAMPTGFGKGRVIARLIDATEHKKILLVVGTKNILLGQSLNVLGDFNWEAIRGIVNDEIGRGYSFGILPDTSNDVTVCTWQGLGAYMRRKTKPEQFGLVIVDEVHNAGTKVRLNLLKRLKATHAIGLTATPYRSSGEYRSPEEYGFKIVDNMSLPECIRKKWLTSLLGKPIDMGVVLPAEVRNGEELNRKTLYRALRKYPELFQTIARKTLPYIQDGKKTIIAVNRVKEEACVIAKELERAGVKVGLAVNQLAAKQLSNEFVTLDAIERYGLPRNHPDSIQVLISPQVIGEGFDHPATECIVWAAPTLSALRYTQVMGRGARRYQGKRVCLILDFVYMIENYGYSMNFAQFFHYDDLVELEGGFFYLGSDLSGLADLVEKTGKLDKPISAEALATIEIPDAGEWKPILTIARILGKGQRTVIRAIKNLGTRAVNEKRRVPHGQIRDCYSPETILLLEQVFTVPEAENWRTVTEIAKDLGVDRSTVTTTIHKHDEITGEKRRIASGNICICYSPKLIKYVMEMIDKPVAGEWKTIGEIAREANTSGGVISNIIISLGNKVSGEVRKIKSGHLLKCYSPKSVELIKQTLLSSIAIELSGWKTAGEIARLLECHSRKVKRLVDKLDIQSKKRRAGNGKLSDFYPPESIEQIRQELEKKAR